MKLSGDAAVPSRINGLEPKPVRIAPGAAVQRRQEQALAQNAAGSEAEPDVKLTGRAQQLAAIEQNLRAMPAVDELRTAAVKQRLDSGDYKVDPQRIADKLLRLEGEFTRNNPFEHSPLK